MADKTQKTRRRKFKFIEGKEPVFVYIGIGIVYILLMFLIALMFISVQDKIRLEMKFDSEKSFNSIYLAINDGLGNAEALMRDQGISAIGIYSSTGRPVMLFGNAPQILPISQLVNARQNAEDSTLGIYVYNEESRTIEYFRLSRLNTMLEMGTLYYGASDIRQRYSDVPEIIYVKFDGSVYFSSINRMRIFAFLGIGAVTLMALLVISIYNSNRRYRAALARHENLASLGAAARTLTHEIKNPLSAMKIQNALLHKMLPPEYSQDLDVMDREIERLTNLTNRVSEFMKDPVGQPQVIDLVRFLPDIARLFECSIKLNFNRMDSICILFDPDRARSVFENLIKNATESAQDRKPEIEVEVRRTRKKTVTILVKDRGDGLPEELSQETLFDPFFTTKAKGSGIGLSISRQFIGAAGGRLSLKRRDGGGTVCEVVLPSYGAE